MNHLFTDYAKSLYDDNVQLDARLMVKVLHVSLQALTIDEISIKKLSQLFNLDVDEVYMNKRFDFVDVTNKRVYEFDGDHHFTYVDHFHGKYENFVEQRRRDILKQKFVVENGFDLVRVTGKLTVHQFIDIITKSNLQVGQSLFIENSDYQVVKTRDLACELNEVEMLQAENAQLRQEIRELKRRYDVNDWSDIQVDEDDVSNIVDPTNLIINFINNMKSSLGFVGSIPLKILYSQFMIETSHNVNDLNMPIQTFTKTLKSLSQELDFTYENKQRRFNAKSNPNVKVIYDILHLDNDNGKYSLANLKQRSIKFNDVLSKKQATNIYNIENAYPHFKAQAKYILKHIYKQSL